MNLLIRLLWTIIQALWRPRLGFWETSTVQFHVLPNDIDINLHMTNSRYLSIMDLGRIDYLIRSGLGKMMIQDKCQAILGAAIIRYRRALKPLQCYTLNTRVITIDDRWSYIEQQFISQGEVVAYALVRGTFTNKEGRVPHALILERFGLNMPDTAIPEAFKLWDTMDDTRKDKDSNE